LLVPDPALPSGVFDPYAVLVPYSKYQLVDCPFGFTVPLTVADDGPTEDAEPVTTTGGGGVLKVPSAPRPVPALLAATNRK
jgi:hypothetical protein